MAYRRFNAPTPEDEWVAAGHASSKCARQARALHARERMFAALCSRQLATAPQGPGAPPTSRLSAAFNPARGYMLLAHDELTTDNHRTLQVIGDTCI